ncbi:hypothetical protein GCM10010220_45840 [Streptomyces parvulus]|nr:hypothetical protein GCM10010220_45840 [Streptomyces parvulus]
MPLYAVSVIVIAHTAPATAESLARLRWVVMRVLPRWVGGSVGRWVGARAWGPRRAGPRDGLSGTDCHGADGDGAASKAAVKRGTQSANAGAQQA